MAVVQLLSTYYEGLSTDDKPTGVVNGTLFRETDTRALYVTYDGTNWEVADRRIRLVNEDGSFIDLPGEFDDLITAITNVGVEVTEVEKHIHAHEKWMGVAASPSGETHIADRLGPSISPFALLSGDDAYGNWVQVMGSSDSPIESGNTKMDAHRILVTTTDSTEAFVVQFAIGESSGLAALIAAEDMTEFAYISATNNADSGISEIRSKRITSGSKVWARAICIGQDAKTINIYVGIHEYIV